MRRAFLFILCAGVLALSAQAQIGKQVMVRAGTPEDRALNEIYKVTDPAQKLALIEKFIRDFGNDDSILLGLDLLMIYHMEAKAYDKVFEVGAKALERDSLNFTAAYRMFTAAQAKGDIPKLAEYSEKVAAIVHAFKQLPPPAGMDPASWSERKTAALTDVEASIGYVEYAMFTAAYQVGDGVAKGELLERFVAAFPESQYTANAEQMATNAYLSAQAWDKMTAFAQKILGRKPDNVQMLLILADYWSERGEQLEKAEDFGKRGLTLLESAEKPAHLTDDQWTQQKALQTGLLQSSLGQCFIHRNLNDQAVEAFRIAGPLVRADNNAYARNQYRLGYTLAKMNRMADARAALLEAVALETPYKELAQQTLQQIGPARPRKRQ